jgi:predicted metal-dependent hydrolase
LVHEITHLWVNGHGVEFQRRMDEYLPDWRERRHALNKELVW